MQKVEAVLMSSTDSDHGLLVRVQDGDEAAFGELHHKYIRSVAWTARSLLGSTQWSEDAAQATFIALWKRSKKIVLAGDSLLPWLLGACRLECRKISTREGRNANTSLDEHPFEHADSGPSVEDQIVRQDLMVHVNACVAELSQIDRGIYRLCLVNEYSYAAAARELGITHGTVRNRLSRLKKNLRQFLHSQEPEEIR